MRYHSDISMLKLPLDTEIEFDSAVVTIGLSGGSEIETTEVVAMLKDEHGTLHLKQSDGTISEFPRGYLYFRIAKGD
jgi:hypothetical protein